MLFFGFDLKSLEGLVTGLNRKKEGASDFVERNHSLLHPVVEAARTDLIPLFDGPAPD